MKHEGRDSSTTTAPTTGPGLAAAWRQAGRQAAYLGVALATLALAALALAALAVALQSGRDEARSADLALVVAPELPPASLADATFELYRRGYVPRVVIVGAGQAGLKAQLVERGVPEDRLESAPDEEAETAELRRRAREAAAGGASSALVVATPAETLRALKVVRDQGLQAYGSPAGAGGGDPLSLAGASARYWSYVLLGR